MTTMNDMIADTRRMVYGSLAESINIISADAAAGASTLTMELDVSGISAGMVLSSKLNVWYVKGIVPTSKTVLVIPGYDNAPQGAVSVNDIVYIKPRVTEWFLFNTLNDVIRQLSSPTNGLYRESTFTLNVDPIYETYDIPIEAEGMIGISRIYVSWPGTTDTFSDLKPWMWDWQPSKSLIRITRNLPAASTITVVYKAPFAPATTLSDNVVTVCGLSDTMTDIPPLGAATALLRTTEARRNQIQVQGDPRRADEVPAGSNQSIAQAFARDFRDRVQDEYARLIQRTPIMKGV
jgi:hypothetical protein